MCITKKNAKRSDVWRKFLELRVAGRQPILMDSSNDMWSFVCVPDEVQPEWDDNLDFLRDMEFEDSGGAACDDGVCGQQDDLEHMSEDAFEDTPPFIGGWVGFITYNQGLKWMDVDSRHKSKVPLMWWRFCSEVYAFKIEEEDGGKGDVLDEATFLKLDEADEPEMLAKTDQAALGEFKIGEIDSNVSWEEYEEGIDEVKKLLHDGETYQVNFAQQFSADFEGDSFALYVALFRQNPSAMCFFAEGSYGVEEAEGQVSLQNGNENGDGNKGAIGNPWAICSNSPERLFSLRGRKMRTEPIKGTVAHDKDPQFLLEDEKSYAELTMIVDLVRNDFGRVAKLGSVKVLEHQALMELKNVWHTYSVVEAKLAEGKTVADLIKAMFPGGSIVGCPKKRTMEIIDRLVDFSWGAYCGSAGYVSMNGNADFNIMIRTAQVLGGAENKPGDKPGGGHGDKQMNGRVEFGAGGGIIMDSVAAAEYQETKDKAAIFRELFDS